MTQACMKFASRHWSKQGKTWFLRQSDNDNIFIVKHFPC